MSDFVHGLDRRSFELDEMVKAAVLYQLVILGEAAKRLSEEFKRQHASIRWREMSGLRNKVTHDYDEVDLDIVWETLQASVPLLDEAR